MYLNTFKYLHLNTLLLQIDALYLFVVIYLISFKFFNSFSDIVVTNKRMCLDWQTKIEQKSYFDCCRYSLDSGVLGAVCLQDCQVEMLTELTHIKDVMDTLHLQAAEPFVLSATNERVILDRTRMAADGVPLTRVHSNAILLDDDGGGAMPLCPHQK